MRARTRMPRDDARGKHDSDPCADARDDQRCRHAQRRDEVLSGPVVPVSDECDAGDHRTAHNESVSFPVRPRRYRTRRRTLKSWFVRAAAGANARASSAGARSRGSAPGRPPVSVPARARARAAVRRMAGRAGWVRAVGQIYRYRRGSVGARRAAHDRVVRIAPAHPDRFRARDRVADRPNPQRPRAPGASVPA